MPRTAPPIMGIYIIKNRLDGKVYIGQSGHIRSRLDHHFARNNVPRLTRSRHLYYAMEKYGRENFEWEILEVVDGSKNIDEREQYWIDFYDSMNKSNGYNLRSASHSSVPYTMRDMTDDDRRVLSDAAKLANKNRWSRPGERERMSAIMAKRMAARSPDEIERMSATHRTPQARAKRSSFAIEQMKDESQRQLRRETMVRNFNDPEIMAGYEKNWEARRKAVVQVDIKTGEVIAVYKSGTAAGAALGVNSGTVTGACKNYCRWSAAGFYWKYENDDSEFDPNGRPDISRGGGRMIRQISIQTGDIIAVFDKITDGAAAVGKTVPTLWRALKNPRHRTAGGFYWEYVD